MKLTVKTAAIPTLVGEYEEDAEVLKTLLADVLEYKLEDEGIVNNTSTPVYVVELITELNRHWFYLLPHEVDLIEDQP